MMYVTPYQTSRQVGVDKARSLSGEMVTKLVWNASDGFFIAALVSMTRILFKLRTVWLLNLLYMEYIYAICKHVYMEL